MPVVRKVHSSELIGNPQFDLLVSQYDDECSMKEMPPINWHKDMYVAMETAGVLHSFAAYDEEKIIGFAVVLATVVPHYSALVATMESIFVGAEHRSTGAGLKLIRMVEGFAKEIGAVGLFLSAPHGSDLAKVTPRIGYTKTNEIFFKGLT